MFSTTVAFVVVVGLSGVAEVPDNRKHTGVDAWHLGGVQPAKAEAHRSHRDRQRSLCNNALPGGAHQHGFNSDDVSKGLKLSLKRA